MIRRPLATLAVILLATSCASWETTRREIVDPLNELLHQRFPAAIEKRDVEALVSLYVPESAERAETEVRAILASWSVISRADCIIRSLDADGDESATAMTDLRIDGFDALGEKQTLLETVSFRCARRADGWKIVDNTCTDSSRYASRGPVFVDEAESRGLCFVQKSCGVVDRLGIERTYLPGSGLAVGDIDGDGSDDVVLIGGRDIRLFL